MIGKSLIGQLIPQLAGVSLPHMKKRNGVSQLGMTTGEHLLGKKVKETGNQLECLIQEIGINQLGHLQKVLLGKNLHGLMITSIILLGTQN